MAKRTELAGAGTDDMMKMVCDAMGEKGCPMNAHNLIRQKAQKGPMIRRMKQASQASWSPKEICDRRI